MEKDNQSQLLDSRAVAEVLLVSESTLSRMRKDKTGPAFIEVRRNLFRYRRSAVETWLERQEAASGAA